MEILLSRNSGVYTSLNEGHVPILNSSFILKLATELIIDTFIFIDFSTLEHALNGYQAFCNFLAE
jgi:hypothetical protein